MRGGRGAAGLVAAGSFASFLAACGGSGSKSSVGLPSSLGSDGLAGLINLTSYFARLWGPHGVRVNALSPGGVQADQDPEFVRKYSDLVPLGRMAEVADLTGPLLFLASDASRYVNGHNLQVDGGFTA